MKKLIKLILPAILIFLLPLTAHAYNVVNLPESMTISDAMGIFDRQSITKITVSDIEDGRYITLDKAGITRFYNDAMELTVHRAINPTPYRGIAINVYTKDEVETYLINSGIPIGLYGSENYVCYKLTDQDTEKLLYLESDYYDSDKKQNGETIHRDASKDFLKLPSAQWAKSFTSDAAKYSLLPYELTSVYANNISREQFCTLLGRLIAVHEGYASIESYMQNTDQPYLKNYFEDCQNVDDSVNILYALGIVTGKDETHFDPTGELTREQAAVLLCKTAERYMWIGTESSLGYEDRRLISDWAIFPVMWVSENGVMTGMTEDTFVPQGAYTVEQAIVTIVRLYNLMN